MRELWRHLVVGGIALGIIVVLYLLTTHRATLPTRPDAAPTAGVSGLSAPQAPAPALLAVWQLPTPASPFVQFLRHPGVREGSALLGSLFAVATPTPAAMLVPVAIAVRSTTGAATASPPLTPNSTATPNEQATLTALLHEFQATQTAIARFQATQTAIDLATPPPLVGGPKPWHTLTLHLRANARPCVAGSPLGSPAPADMPPGNVALAVPLYPRAARISTCAHDLLFAPMGIATTPYLKTDAAAFVVPLSATDAELWYRGAFAQDGYEGGGSGGCVRNGNTAASYGGRPRVSLFSVPVNRGARRRRCSVRTASRARLRS